MDASRPTPVLRWIAAHADADRCVVLAAAENPDCPAIVAMSQALSPTQLLHQRYRESLPLKHAEIGAQWQALQADPGNCAALQKLQQLLHRLAGSAGAYGYNTIGNLARDADAMIILRNDPLAGDSCALAFTRRLDAPVQRLLHQLADAFKPA